FSPVPLVHLNISSTSFSPARLFSLSSFFFHHPATTEIYTLSLHDALPILSFRMQGVEFDNGDMYVDGHKAASDVRDKQPYGRQRSEERFSRNAETDLVCRLLLEKKKKNRARNITPWPV